MSPPTKRSSMQRALRARDAGLRKISVATRVLVAGAVVASGCFTALAAWAQPGRSKVGAAGQGQASAAASVANGGQRSGSATGNDDTNLSPPATLPAPSYENSGPVVVSGAS